MLLSACYSYSFWMRTCAYLASHSIFRLLFPAARRILRYSENKHGISISHRAQISSGFYISQAGGIVIDQDTVIGKNCNISQQVTLGKADGGAGNASPVIGDAVYIGPGAKVIGNLRVGNQVVISADCVVTEDIPDKSIVFGAPGRVVSSEGSREYIYRTDYDR